jgi:aquaporin Z
MEKSILKQFIAELLGTFIFLLVGYAAVAAIIENQQAYLLPSIAFGGILLVMIYLWHNYSALFNPAFTFVSLLDQRINYKQAALFTAAQFIAAVFAGIIIYWLYGNSGVASGSLNETSIFKAFIVEILFSIFLVLVFLFVTQVDNWYSGLAIGITLIVLMLAAYPLTGASLNPARAFGSNIYSKTAAPQLWLYIIGPIIGALVAYLIYLCYQYFWNKKEIITTLPLCENSITQPIICEKAICNTNTKESLQIKNNHLFPSTCKQPSPHFRSHMLSNNKENSLKHSKNDETKLIINTIRNKMISI